MKDQIDQMSKEILSLSYTIRAKEEEMRAEDDVPLQVRMYTCGKIQKHKHSSQMPILTQFFSSFVTCTEHGCCSRKVSDSCLCCVAVIQTYRCTDFWLTSQGSVSMAASRGHQLWRAGQRGKARGQPGVPNLGEDEGHGSVQWVVLHVHTLGSNDTLGSNAQRLIHTNTCLILQSTGHLYKAYIFMHTYERIDGNVLLL